MMTALTIAVACLAVLCLATLFLLLGLMRRLDLLDWEFLQFDVTVPRRAGRTGLEPGAMAPGFTLPGVDGRQVSLNDYAGRKRLLVFTQDGCGPCGAILPELARFQQQNLQVLVVNNGANDSQNRELRSYAAKFPVLNQTALELSKRYQIVSSPFAFVIDESGRVAARAVVASAQQIQFLLESADEWQESMKRVARRVQHAGAGAATGPADMAPVAASGEAVD